MERRVLANRWQSERWAPVDVVPDDGGSREPRLLEEDSEHARWLTPGFAIELHRDEVSVTAIRRDGILGQQPTPTTVLREGDVVILAGTPEALQNGEARLLMG